MLDISLAPAGRPPALGALPLGGYTTNRLKIGEITRLQRAYPPPKKINDLKWKIILPPHRCLGRMHQPGHLVQPEEPQNLEELVAELLQRLQPLQLQRRALHPQVRRRLCVLPAEGAGWVELLIPVADVPLKEPMSRDHLDEKTEFFPREEFG